MTNENNIVNDRKNSEGYMDPTPHDAIENIEKENQFTREEYMKFKTVINTFFNICNLAGIRVESRIVLKDKETGKIWK